MINTVLPLNKPVDITSAKFLDTFKYSSYKKLKEKGYDEKIKIGHTGTLDSFASGLIISLLGSYTKLNENYMNLKKSYRAKIKFGYQTDTLERTGNVLYKTDNIPTLNQIESVLTEKFTGEILQHPPLYSALKVNGKRLSDIARSGESVEIKPRKVNIYSHKIIDYSDGILDVEFEVSRGTYIRSISRDIALSLSSFATLIQLERFAIGSFTKEDTTLFNIEDFSNVKDDCVLSVGVFDGVHIGHQKLISLNVSEAKKNSLKSVVITFDASTKNNIKQEILPLKEKINKIYSLGVDKIEVLHWDEELKKQSGVQFFINLLKKYNIKKIVTGDDFSVGSKFKPLTYNDLNLFFKEKDIITVEYVKDQNNNKISSSDIHKKLGI